MKHKSMAQMNKEKSLKKLREVADALSEVEDVIRYEEQEEKEYQKQLKKFFKGEDEKD